jgi:urease accessory protein UreF
VDLYPLLDRVAEEALATPAEEAFSFCPAFDLASIAHETLETRLYIS